MLKLKQNEVQLDYEDNLVNIHSFNFIRDLRCNEIEKEVKMIHDCMFRIWNKKNLKKYIFEEMESNLFLFNSEFKNQGIVHF